MHSGFKGVFVKLKLLILKNQNEEDHFFWIKACDEYRDRVSYQIVDITTNNWLKKITDANFDYILTRAPGNSSLFKQLYDERLYIISKVLQLPIYPTYDENLIYENKRLLSYWLKAKKIKHPNTYVFYDKKEANKFAEECKFPIVAKTNIGASGSGVKIIKSRSELKVYITRAFNGKGIRRRWWPNTTKKNLLHRAINKMKDPQKSVKYYSDKYKFSKMDNQKYFILLQEFIEFESEWRCVIIGDSYFGHRKEKLGALTSGGGGIIWDCPSEKLLNFLKKLKEDGNLVASSLDIIETSKNEFFVIEIQSFFGYIDSQNQMYRNDIPGRFIFADEKWVFEEGVFNRNNSYNLRLEHLLNEKEYF
jgi:glutathione synthase/RimK-type ligase-like ATP-grasp enzyme